MNEKIKSAIVIGMVVLIGLMCLYYIAKLTAFNNAVVDPCGVCASIPENKHLVKCFEDVSIVKTEVGIGHQVNTPQFNITIPS